MSAELIWPSGLHVVTRDRVAIVLTSQFTLPVAPTTPLSVPWVTDGTHSRPAAMFRTPEYINSWGESFSDLAQPDT